MKIILKSITLLVILTALSGCGLAKGVMKDFGGYGEQLSNKVQPKEYDTYDSSVNTSSGKATEATQEPEIVVTNKNYKGGVRENDLAIVIGIEKYRNIPSSDFSASDAFYV